MDDQVIISIMIFFSIGSIGLIYDPMDSSLDSSLSSRWWKTTSDTDPALIPGGFAEACFASSAERKADCFGMVGNVGKNYG